MHRIIATTLFALLSLAVLSGVVRQKSLATSSILIHAAADKAASPMTEKTASGKSRRASSALAQTPCGNVQLQLTPDYGFAIGSSSGGMGSAFTLNGRFSQFSGNLRMLSGQTRQP